MRCVVLLVQTEIWNAYATLWLLLKNNLDLCLKRAEKRLKVYDLSRTKRDYDGALGFHNYKTSDRLLTRFENDNIAFKDED